MSEWNTNAKRYVKWGSVSNVLDVIKSRLVKFLDRLRDPASILEMSSRNLLHIFSGTFMAKKDICWVLLEQAWAIDQSLVIPMRTPKEAQAACRLHFFCPLCRCPNRETAHAYLRPLNTPIDPPTTTPLHSTAILPRSIRLWQCTRREAWRVPFAIWVASCFWVKFWMARMK